MADNTVLNANTTTGDTIRTVLLAGAKTQVMKLDIGGEASEVFCNGQVPVTFSSPATLSIRANYTTAQTDTSIVSPGGGLTLTVTRITVTAANSNTADVSFRIGCGTTNTPTTNGVILSHPGIANNSSITAGDGLGTLGKSIVLGDPLRITCSVPTGGSIDVDVTYNAA